MGTAKEPRMGKVRKGQLGTELVTAEAPPGSSQSHHAWSITQGWDGAEGPHSNTYNKKGFHPSPIQFVQPGPEDLLFLKFQ